MMTVFMMNIEEVIYTTVILYACA